MFGFGLVFFLSSPFWGFFGFSFFVFVVFLGVGKGVQISFKFEVWRA